MSKGTQISALISATTRGLLTEHVRATGVKKGHLIEEALRHHLLALNALPADVLVRPRIVLSRRSGAEMAKRLRGRRRPTPRLRALMRGDGD